MGRELNVAINIKKITFIKSSVPAEVGACGQKCLYPFSPSKGENRHKNAG